MRCVYNSFAGQTVHILWLTTNMSSSTLDNNITKRKDSGKTKSDTRRKGDHKRFKSDKEIPQSTIGEAANSSSKCGGIDRIYSAPPIGPDYAPHPTLTNIAARMKHVLNEVNRLKKGLHETKTLHIINAVYGNLQNVANIYACDNFDVNELVKNDQICDIIQKADALLLGLRQTGNVPQPQYKDLHMRKAPATCMGFIDNPEEKLSMDEVITMYLEYRRKPFTSVPELYNIIDPMIMRQETNRHEMFLTVMGYELLLLLQVLIFPYVYHSLTKWPSCDGLKLDESKPLLNTEYLLKAFALVERYCSIKKRVEIKAYDKAMNVVAEIKYHRIVIGLLCGMITPRVGVRNDCLRFLAIHTLLNEHEKSYRKNIRTETLPALTNEEKKYFLTNLERQHLMEFKRHTICFNPLANFIDERKKMLKSLQVAK